MSESSRVDTFALVDRLVMGEISDEEAGILLQSVQKNERLAETIRANYRADFLLWRLYSTHGDEEDIERLEEAYSRESNEDKIPDSDDLAAILAEMVQHERCALPYVRMKLSEIVVDEKQSLDENRPMKMSTGKKHRVESTPRFDLPFIIRVCLYFGCVVWLCLGTQHGNDRNQVVAFRPIATVVETIDAVWTPDAKQYRRGQQTGEGSFSLQSGLIQLETNSGTRLLLEGPGEFVLTTPRDAFCARGKISAFIPDGKTGFEVTTPHGVIVDRGTAFYLEITENESLLDVVAGQVDVVRDHTVLSSLVPGLSALVQLDATPKIETTTKSRYMTDEVFHTKLTDYVQREMQSRNKEKLYWSRHADTLVCLDFQGELRSTLPNQSQRGAQRVPEVTLHAARVDEGPYYQTKSVSFSSKNDYAEFKLPGQFSALTLLAEVRIDNISNTGNVLFATAGHLLRSGGFLWQIDNRGRMQIQMTNRKNEVVSFESPIIMNRGQWRTWRTLAVSLDSRKECVVFYADGRQVASFPWKNAVPMTIEQAYIGNLPPDPARITNRFLGGSFGQFVLLETGSLPENNNRTENEKTL